MTSDRRAEFRRFAQLQEAQASPLYSHLAARIADDPRGYDEFFAAIPAHEQAPNMLFAAVQLRMLAEPETPLANYYASLHASPRPPDAHAYSLFREYCDAHRDALFSVLREHRTQTNEVRRGLALWPAGMLAITIAQGLPLALVEIGCSAGLNLLWDRYSYRYRDSAGAVHDAGNANSSLQMDAELRGPLVPPLAASPLRISQRIGIDLQPLDIHSSRDIAWLEALIWPEHHDRRQFLRQAIAIAREEGLLDLRRGDALEQLPTVADELPAACAPLFFHTYVMQQLNHQDRARLPQFIAHSARRFRHAFHLWHERGQRATHPRLVLRHFARGQIVSERLLAYAGAHVRWLQWRDLASAQA